MNGFRTCGFCNRRMSLRYRKSRFTNEQIPINFKVIEMPDGTIIFAHLSCYRKYKRALARERRIKFSGGINVGLANVSAGIEY